MGLSRLLKPPAPARALTQSLSSASSLEVFHNADRRAGMPFGWQVLESGKRLYEQWWTAQSQSGGTVRRQTAGAGGVFPSSPSLPGLSHPPCAQAGRGWDAGPGKHGTELLGKEWRAGGSHVGCRKSPGTPAKTDETAPWMGQPPMERRLQRDEVFSSEPGAIRGRSKSTAHEMGKC